MTHHKPHIEEMREFAASLDPEIGPVFGQDVVNLIDRHRALVAAVREWIYHDHPTILHLALAAIAQEEKR